jgi:hypothetical protein
MGLAEINICFSRKKPTGILPLKRKEKNIMLLFQIAKQEGSSVICHHKMDMWGQ